MKRAKYTKLEANNNINQAKIEICIEYIIK